MFEAKEIRLEPDDVVIDWSDGHTSRYAPRDLRIDCACAACIEEMTGRRLLDVMSVPVDIFAVDFLPIGRYAVQFAWSDGHSTGIYPFTMLRQMCKCGDDHSDEEQPPAQSPRREGR